MSSLCSGFGIKSYQFWLFHLPWTNDLLFSELIFKIGEITEIIFEVVNDDYRR